jgi:hypothetical protein
MSIVTWEPGTTHFKTKTIKRDKGRKRRAEAKQVKTVRPLCVERDGHCRVRRDVGVMLGGCEGPSEWAHLNEKQRWKTRKMDAEERHTTGGSLMACKKHHDQIDNRRKPRLYADACGPKGADGPLHWHL